MKLGLSGFIYVFITDVGKQILLSLELSLRNHDLKKLTKITFLFNVRLLLTC